MPVAHQNLTGTDLHEPKDIASQTTGKVYLSDGAGSGTWVDFSTQVGNTQRFVGEIFDFAGGSAPTGSLLCRGQNISRVTYSALFAIISTNYGPGDGATTFTLPDCRGRVTAGQDDMGGSSANRLTGTLIGGINGDILGRTGGSESHTLITDELAQHLHAVNITSSTDTPDHKHGFTASISIETTESGSGQSVAADAQTSNTGGAIGLSGGSGRHKHNVTGDTSNTGSNQAHNNVQPTIIFNKCIYTGVL